MFCACDVVHCSVLLVLGAGNVFHPQGTRLAVHAP